VVQREITSYDGRNRKYGVYLLCDQQTVFVLPDDPDWKCSVYFPCGKQIVYGHIAIQNFNVVYSLVYQTFLLQ